MAKDSDDPEQTTPVARQIEDPAAPLRWLRRVESLVVSTFLVSVVALVITQVATRYLFNRPPVWTEEFARYSLVWVTFIGLGLLAADRALITVKVIDLFAPRRVVISVRILAEMATIAVCVTITKASFGFLERVSGQTSAASGIPMSWVYASMAIGFALLLVHATVWLIRDLRELWSRDSVVTETEATEDPLVDGGAAV